MRYYILEICLLGYLKNKTRILFTNTIANLQKADLIYVVDKGMILAKGNFSIYVKLFINR